MPATTATLDLTIWRNDTTFEFALRVIGPNLTGVDMQAQIRRGGDMRALLAGLTLVDNANAEGVRLASAAFVDGRWVNDVRIRLNKTTRQALPYAAVNGQPWVGEWVFVIGGQTRITGAVRVPAHAFDSDAAPLNQAPGSARGATIGEGASGATLTIADTGGATLVIDGADQLGALAAETVEAKAAAETARDRARDWAEGTSEPGGAGSKSAKAWAAQAADAAGRVNNDIPNTAVAALGVFNLFDKTQVIPNANLDATGVHTGDNANQVMGWTRVVPGEKITIGYAGGNPVFASGVPNNYGYRWGDENLAPVADSTTGTPPGSASVTVPAGARFVRTTLSINVDISLLMLIRGEVLPSRYVPCGLGEIAARAADAVRRADLHVADVGIEQLLNPRRVKAGYFYTPAGETLSPNYAIVRIPVTPGLPFVTTLTSLTAPYGVYYAGDGDSYIKTAGEGAVISAGVPRLVPDNPAIRFACFTVVNAGFDPTEHDAVLGTLLPPFHIPFGGSGMMREINLKQGEVCGVIGNSIANNPIWRRYLFLHTGMVEGWVDVKDGRIARAFLDASGNADEQKALFAGHSRCIIGFAPQNDFNNNVPPGTPDDGAGVQSFGGGLNYIIVCLRAANPAMKLMGFSALKSSTYATPNGVGAKLSDYIAVEKAIYARRGIPYLNLFEEGYLCEETWDLYLNNETVKQHPSTTGTIEVVAKPAVGFVRRIG